MSHCRDGDGERRDVCTHDAVCFMYRHVPSKEAPQKRCSPGPGCSSALGDVKVRPVPRACRHQARQKRVPKVQSRSTVCSAAR